MAWPRIKNSRSSALPGTSEHGGVQVTASQAADADPVHATRQNTGITGARHTVVDSPPASARSVRTRYADSGADGYVPTAEFNAVPGPASVEPTDSGIGILDSVATTDFPVADPQAPRPALNQPITQPPQPVGTPLESLPVTQRQPQPGPAGAVNGAVNGAANGGSAATAGNGGLPQRARDLPPDERLRIWRRRALFMVIAGLAFGILTTSWLIGLTLFILAGIIDTIYRSRRVSSLPAGGRVDRAQRQTQRQLARMRRAGYLTLHARPIPDSQDVIDHLVVGPTGVYAIDSEKWRKELPIRTRNGKQLWHGPDSKKDRLEHARWEAQQASERLSAALGTEITVRPAMAVYGPRIPWDIATIREVDVFSGPRIRWYLRHRGRMKDLPRLSPDKVRTIYEAAGAVLPGVAPTRTGTPVG